MKTLQPGYGAPKVKIDWRQIAAAARQPPAPTKFKQRHDFGPNPGALQMLVYAPDGLPPGAALIVVLHGCGQQAEKYAHDAGWIALAERFGFAVLAPQQTRANNPNGCFNWFSAADTTRGAGEAASIRQMIETALGDHNLDRSRVFVTGLSAGGAMTSAMLAAYPDVFAGGSIIAGLPYGAAANVNEALASMRNPPERSGSEWGETIRRASAHRGPWPKIAIWHGDDDAIVSPRNGEACVSQWIDVHGIDGAFADERLNVSHRKRSWRDEGGTVVIESFRLPGFAHGAPIASGSDDTCFGSAGAFVFEAGISASYHTASFWGLTDKHPAPPRQDNVEVEKSAALSGEILFPQDPVPTPHIHSGKVNRVQTVIENALRAAGLMPR